MRTTLSLDDRVLAAARGVARRRVITLGEAVSDLAMLGYETQQSGIGPVADFPMRPLVEGHVITVDMVDDALADD